MNRASIPTIALFARKSLVEQVADTLRVAIEEGKWTRYLPPERSLCRLIDASRPTMRRAIHLLQAEGRLRIIRGHPTEIIQRTVSCAPVKEFKVVMLAGVSLHTLDQWHLMVIDEIRKELANNGCHFEYVVDLRLKRNNPDSVLRTLIDQYEAQHWILYSMPLPVQQWFEDRGFPATLMGHSFPGISLPSVDEDTRVLTRHAMGVLLGLGHRKIVFFSKSAGAAGDAASQTGFEEAIKSHPDGNFQVERHSGDRDQIRARLKRLFLVRERPTGLLVSNAMDTLVVLTWMMSVGIRTPEDVSLISLETASFLNRIVPSVARYEGDSLEFAREVCRLANRMTEKNTAIRLIPSFSRNQTVGRPPA